MPAKSKAQRRFMGMELAKVKKGKKSSTGMKESQLAEFAGTSEKGLPAKKAKKKGGFSSLPR